MRTIEKRIRRLCRIEMIFVPGFVIRTVFAYLERHEPKSAHSANFLREEQMFWASIDRIMRGQKCKPGFEPWTLVKSSPELRNSYLLTWVCELANSSPEGAWVPKTEPCVFRHYYRIALDQSIER